MFRNSVLIALVLLLALGLAGQPAWAQNDDPAVKVQTLMQAAELPTLCLGEVRSLRVWVTRNLIQVSDRWTVPLHLKGLTIVGQVENSAIASLVNPVQTTGFKSVQPGEATFQIHALKLGDTVINFNAPIVDRLAGEVLYNSATGNANSVNLNVAVKVIACNFAFTARSTFETTGLEMHATITKVTLRPDKQGQINRTVTVHWTGRWENVAPCGHKFLVSDTEAYLTGAVDNFGDLVLTVSYQPSTATWHTDCGGPIKSDDVEKLNPTSPLQLNVDVSAPLYENDFRQDVEQTSGQVKFVVVPDYEPEGR